MKYTADFEDLFDMQEQYKEYIYFNDLESSAYHNKPKLDLTLDSSKKFRKYFFHL